MGYSYTRAPTFTSGSDITAENVSKLADAFNDRIKSGVADCSRRIHISILNSMRNVRNPDDTLFPSQIEALTAYNHVPPEAGEVWPDAERGEPQGGNLASPVPAFVFGNPQLFGEGDRLASLIDLIPDSTIKERWDLAKVQRGGIDTASMVQYTPFLSASQEHFRISAAPWTFFLKDSGGYLPAPVVLGVCTDSLTEPSVVFPNQEIKFTRLVDDFEVVYSGTCGSLYGGSDTDVAYIADLPFKWVVYQFNGTITEYPKAEWIEGPYEGGGVLQKKNFDFLNRMMLNSFVKEFKGQQTYEALHISASSSPYPISASACYGNLLSSSFAFQDCLLRPFQLSPAFATIDEEENLDITYPSRSWASNQVAGATTTPYSIHPNFVLGGYYVRGVDLNHHVTVQTLANGNVVNQFLVRSGSSFEDCGTIPTKVTGSISFRLVNDLTFDTPTGSLYIEFSELYLQYPHVWDLYCYLRLSSTFGIISIDTTNDQFGVNETQARLIYDNYTKYGAVINLNGEVGTDQPISSINTNPPYESLRKYIRSFSRYIKKENLTGYEVTGGKSILYFNKKVTIDETEFDMFDGMLNPFDSGSNGIILNNTGSWSNEWCLDIGMKPTNPSESSIWKDSAYYWWGINRALFLNSVIPGVPHSDIFGFVQDGGSNFISEGDLLLTNPEHGITYLNYDRQVNTIGGESPQPSEDFYRSCQVYPPPYVISDIRVVGDEVKITCDRIQHHTDAPSSITRGDDEVSEDETYRTDENAIRDYLEADKDLDTNSIPFRIGDCAARSDRDFFTDQPNGFVPETFCFLKLIPKPYEGNASGSCVCEDPNKTVLSSELLTQCETYLRSFCQGWIDSETPFTCDLLDDASTTSYDFTWETLNYRAHGGSHITWPLREDNGIAFGTFATCIPFASTLNQLSSCINLLTMARLPLPFKLETRTCNYLDNSLMSPDTWINGDSCNGSFISAVKSGMTGTATTLTECGDWTELVPDLGGNLSFGASSGFGWVDGIDIDENGCTEDGIQFIMAATRQTVQYRFQLTDPLSVNCISSELYDNFINGTNGFFAQEENFSSYFTAYTVDNADDSWQSALCGGTEPTTLFFNGTSGIGYNVTEHPSDVFHCKLFTSGIIDPGTPPSTTVVVGRNKGCEPDTTTGTGTVKSQGVIVKNTKTSVISIPLVD